jgi:DNA gyrase inhibitor GyrI
MNMQAVIEKIPALPVVYMRRTGCYGEQNYKLMQDMKHWIQSHDLWSNDGVIYGIAQDNIEMTPPENCRYDVCFVTDSVFNDDIIQYGSLPAGAYIVYQILHTADEVQHFYAALNTDLTTAGKEIDNSRSIMERYQFSLVEKGYCEFCIPIY